MYAIFGQDIIRLPRLFRFLQRPLAQLISTLRAPKSKEGYASIGGGSPLRKITDEQVKYFTWRKSWLLLMFILEKLFLKIEYLKVVIRLAYLFVDMLLTAV